MEECELRRELLAFAGFAEKGSGYVWPDGRFDKAPDFTKSLDACFRWLVPKAVSKIIERLHVDEYAAYGILFGRWHEQLVAWSERPSTLVFIVYPALALCHAVKELERMESTDVKA